MNVLIVEDERSLAREVEEFLSAEQFRCDIAFLGKQAIQKLNENKYDFVLLDLGLPDCDGLTLLKDAKKISDAAFIVITARGSTEDKIEGLELGADDYLAKPFSLPELHARMQAIKRRKFGLKSNILEFDEFRLDTLNRTLFYKDNEIILTRKEFDLLNYLVLNKNRVLTRMQLAEHIAGNILLADDYDSNFIDVHIKNIRKKISAYAKADWLETVRGIGYRANFYK